MNDKDLLKLLITLDLAENEAKCYLALLKKSSMTAGDTSKLSGVPRQNVYKSLEKLLVKGLAVSIPGEIKRFSASDPRLLKDRAVIHFRRAIEDELLELEQKKQEVLKREFSIDPAFDTAVRELSSLYDAGQKNKNPLDYIEIIKDGHQVHRKFVELSEKSKHEILVLSKRSETKRFIKADDAGSKDRRAAVFDRGVKVRCIYDIWPDEEDNKLLLENIEFFTKAGEKARIVDSLPMRLAIFDSKIVMFMLLDPEPRQDSNTVQVIEHPAMAEGLIMLFESIWQRAEDFRVYKKRYMKTLSKKSKR
jgi:sugar-specific transcriptional regulator TrmB